MSRLDAATPLSTRLRLCRIFIGGKYVDNNALFTPRVMGLSAYTNGTLLGWKLATSYHGSLIPILTHYRARLSVLSQLTGLSQTSPTVRSAVRRSACSISGYVKFWVFQTNQTT